MVFGLFVVVFVFSLSNHVIRPVARPNDFFLGGGCRTPESGVLDLTPLTKPHFWHTLWQKVADLTGVLHPPGYRPACDKDYSKLSHSLDLGLTSMFQFIQ